MSVEEIEKYVKNLKETLKDLPPSKIISYDETNLTDEPGKSKCVLKHGVKYLECIMNSTKSVTSIMFAANAVGDVMTPCCLQGRTFMGHLDSRRTKRDKIQQIKEWLV